MNTKDIIARTERGGRLAPQEATRLWEDAPLALLGALAAAAKRRKSGDAVFFNRNVHIEPTNICIFRCRFCSFCREAGDTDAWMLTPQEIGERAAGYAGSDITEVHIVGGVHPEHTLDTYVEMVRRVKEALPQVTVKAFTAIELRHVINKAGLPLSEGLRMLRDAGMEAIPGGGAEIFDARLRVQICPEKGSAEEWLEVHEVAHELGIRTNATMLYGHGETVAQRLDHLLRLRELQDRTGGFDAFIPLKFRSRGNRMSGCGEVDITDDMRTLAMSRLVLDNFPHVKAYWPMYGKAAAELALSFGADDIDGTIGDTTKIYSMAGAEEARPVMTLEDIARIAAAAGLRAVERDTFYRPIAAATPK
ncbi:MAG: CofH family radical SAM protein [Rikenellaceae bacterium]|nr:CofH family radical SAM protein [Rikenellaceae bacterium]MCL2692700.1 CofH family radical SAM protein [Rikenellaceae bacterium]